MGEPLLESSLAQGAPIAEVEAVDHGRRNFLRFALDGAITAVGIKVLAACSSSDSPEPASSPDALEDTTTLPPSPEGISSTELLDHAAQSLIDLHEETENGWRFFSAVQAHYQTDRDVGASSVGMGFLVMAEQSPEDPRWLQAAERTAGWLTEVSQNDEDGRIFWSDYVDDNDISSNRYTSFDDGTIGVGDFFWQLYEKTQNEEYKEVALSTLRWTFAQAENIGNPDAPVYQWPWNVGEGDNAYHMGMGMGAAGLVHTFATYYERLRDGDPELANQCKQYVDGTLRYIDQVRVALGNNDGDARALPETGIIGEDGDTAMNSGYLSGAAGAAFMYLKLADTFDNPRYAAEAERIFSWLEDTENGPMVVQPDGSVAWKLALDPQGEDDPVLATGFEEGSAGIGWTYLQAYKLTNDERYLMMAKRAADWLATVAVPENGGITWHEYEAPAKPVVHANLNNGAAGIGMFLRDLAEVSSDVKYQDLAQQSLNWLTGTAVRDQNNTIYWNDNDGEANYSRDPSWHWGTAGIVAFAARMSGGTVDIPGQQPGLNPN